MRKYTVYLKDSTTHIDVQADDVELDVEERVAFWNFLSKADDEEDSVTVAAFPFDGVAYVLSA